ncbi:MAG: DUF3047 domain-containing protein [Rubrivivax sp.]
MRPRTCVAGLGLLLALAAGSAGAQSAAGGPGAAAGGAAAPAAGATPAPAAAAGCTARPLPMDGKAPPWGHAPLSRLKKDTRYELTTQEGRQVLMAQADGSASLYGTSFRPARGSGGWLRWSWKTDALVPDADNADPRREDAPLRVVVAFDGDAAKLPLGERARRKMAETMTGRPPPYAALIYIWGSREAPGTVIPSAHTSAKGPDGGALRTGGRGRWPAVRRTLRAHSRRAYSPAPGPVVAVAVMTDTDNTGKQAAGMYSGFGFDCAAR